MVLRRVQEPKRRRPEMTGGKKEVSYPPILSLGMTGTRPFRN